MCGEWCGSGYEPDQSSDVAQLKADNDRLKQHLRDEGDRISELYDALHSLVTAARRCLPDYELYPEVQKAEKALRLE